MSEGSGKRIGGSLLAFVGVLLMLLGGLAFITASSGTGSGALVMPIALLVAGIALLLPGIQLVRSGERSFQRTRSGAPSFPQSQDTSGTASKSANANAIGSVAGLIVFGIMIWYYFGGGLDRQANRQLQEIKDKVAADAVTQYGIAKRNGSAIDVCVQAGLVTAAYLQAQDEAHYQEWKQIEKADCAKAGLSK